MTDEEILKIKEHIEIHARLEPQAVKITQILWKAVEELESIKELQEKNNQLEEMLAEQYPDLKQSLDWANEREKELLEQIADLKDYILKVSKFLHDNYNIRPDKLAYKERDMLLIKELKLFEKWELSK